MAPPDKRDGSASPVSFVAALVVALLGLVVQQWPFVGSRPPGDDLVKPSLVGIQSIPARLWQDPFSAVSRFEKPESTGSAEMRLVELESYLRCQNTGLDIAVVTVFGGHYPEHYEHRRRTRYAVLSGLSRAGFVPAREEALGYFGHDEVREGPAIGSDSARPKVPFELLRHEPTDGPARPGVLLLWLDEDALSETPLKQVSQLIGRIRAATKCPGRDVLLGPIGSRMLEAVARTGLPAGVSLQVFSTATKRVEGNVRFLRRVILSDDQLMERLVGELQSRRVDVRHRGRDNHQVVLISEWDTPYGRSLPKSFVRHVCERPSDCPWIHTFTYLRGLDGVVAEAPRPAVKKDDGSKPSEPRSHPPAPIERADGNSQYDYVRRLIDRIRAIEADWHPQGGAVRAVGILGSDVYDKLLILQALRREFPKAVFFTTDLDARLMHPAELGWTKNLVVASSFGLALRSELQGPIPPFRDSYQTASFLAAQAAWAAAPPGSPTGLTQETLDTMIRPRLYEIGRHVAVDLTSDSAGKCPQIATCDNVNSPAPALVPKPTWDRVGLGTAILMGFALIVLSTSRRVRQAIIDLVDSWSRATRGHRWLSIGTIGLGIALTGSACLAVLYQGPDGEPFAWTSGASIWPTEILRLLAIILSLWFLVDVRRRFTLFRERFAADFGKWEPRPRPIRRRRGGPLAGAASWLTGIPRSIWDMTPATLRTAQDTEREVAATERRLNARSLWAHYWRQSSPRAQAQRVLPTAALLYLVSFLIMSFDWPVSPARGSVAFTIDRVILLVFCVPLFLVLVLAVGDTIRLGNRYGELLGEPAPTRWPDQTVAHVGRRLGLVMGKYGDQRLIEEKCVSHWVDIQVITTWTDVVNPIIYYPFVVLCLMILARNSLFDDWHATYALWFVFVLSGLYAAGCAFLLRRVAERARRVTIGRFTQLLIEAKGDPRLSSLSGQIQAMISEVEALKVGAFAPFTEQPAVRALLLPFLTIGGPALLEYINRGGP